MTRLEHLRVHTFIVTGAQETRADWATLVAQGSRRCFMYTAVRGRTSPLQPWRLFESADRLCGGDLRDGHRLHLQYTYTLSPL
jgi:hypothetical protein